ncbi:hypothetical protein [uncultured Aureimonas sp.]|uniref:hypothetical protein n=1 Tax=uncultured Aureimonas sp. TaxID=1604662 RepID=UPI0025DC8D5C|nr:hypothetical protein [uncultured Aureimonas sp.]
MIHLIEIEPFDPAANAPRILRFGTFGFTTEPGDTPANAHFDDLVKDPGNFERFLFGRSRTRGESDVGGGDIQLVNADGSLDGLLDLAFDGRPIRIWSLESQETPWAERRTVFTGTMEQAEFPSRAVTIRIRDMLDALREPLERPAYLGTTTSGGLTIAEGNTDLKDVKKPRLYGRALNIAPVTVDQFDNLYQVSDRAIAEISNVRDNGVKLTATGDHADLAALKGAVMTGGQYATCLALGLLRTYTRPAGTLTLDAAEGATLADRSVARNVARVLDGLAVVDAGSIDALHAEAPAEAGFWTGTADVSPLRIASALLESIGGWLVPDRFGTFRVGRLRLPSGEGVVRITTDFLLGGDSLFRNATADEGAGVPARSVTVRYGRAWTTYSEADLKDVASDDVYRAFAIQEFRQIKLPVEANTTLHPKGPDLTKDTCLVLEADAKAEAERWRAIEGDRRDLFVLDCWGDDVAAVDLDDVITLEVDRFGMGGGRPLRVIGLTESRLNNHTEIEAWG